MYICNQNINVHYKCALNDFTNVHQPYIIMEVCDVLCKVHIQGTFKVVWIVHLRYKKCELHLTHQMYIVMYIWCTCEVHVNVH